VSRQLSSTSLAVVKPPRKLVEQKEKLVAIVDDDRSICASVSKLIERLGYRSPIVAHDGEEIVTAIVNHGLSPDVIMMDYRPAKGFPKAAQASRLFSQHQMTL
jgi:DNA-binding NtrC family response regulator